MSEIEIETVMISREEFLEKYADLKFTFKGHYRQSGLFIFGAISEDGLRVSIDVFQKCLDFPLTSEKDKEFNIRTLNPVSGDLVSGMNSMERFDSYSEFSVPEKIEYEPSATAEGVEYESVALAA